MGTKFLTAKGAKATKNSQDKTSCAFLYFVDKKFCVISWMFLFSLALAAGCSSRTASTTTAQPQQPTRPMQALSPLDPCPERLHDIAGALLNFLVQHGRLPPTLEDLPPIRTGTPLVLSCPLTNQKYIYNPNGIKVPPNRWAIVYDPAPSHSNYRWSIVFSESSQQGQAPIPSVLAIPESEFKAASELPSLSK
jgi:hypothetical protein